MTRARVENAAQFAVRSAAGIRASITDDFSGWNSPALSAISSRAASTVISRSAGLLAPSFLSRSSSSSSLPSRRLILMPVCFVKSVYSASSVW